MTGARRLLWPVVVLALIIAACGPDDEEQRAIDEEQRLIAEQQRITDLENVITPPPATEEA